VGKLSSALPGEWKKKDILMRRLVGFTACLSVLALGGVARAAEADPETAQFVCDLTGDCSGDSAAVAAPSTPAPATSGARTSSTRGFSFQRATSEGQAATPAPSRPTQMASAPPVQRSISRPAQIGSSNLQLSFVTGSAILTEPAKVRLAKYAAALGSPQIASRRVRIEGHTDASGSQKSNQALSQRRAQAVADFLIAAGIPASRFEVVGFGSSRLLPGVTPQSAANRRVMAVLL
jgi:outer membrane protein OmpA-like peptidoglycan-associated protein